MPIATMRELLEAGVHFGHQTRRWNPKMKPFIFTERKGNYIIDLQKTLTKLDEAYDAVREIVKNGEAILFVGTKKQASTIIKEEALRCGMFYVTERWLGGMLTNFQTIRQSIRRLDQLDKMSQDGTYEQLTKKERLQLDRERDKLLNVLEGIRDMNRLPGAIFVVDTKKEAIAVAEGNKLEVPVVAILDTNCDPDPIDYPIPGNDDALRSITLITKIIADAAAEGAQDRESEQAAAEMEDKE
jgi:small subunit ribosomal protein S2